MQPSVEFSAASQSLCLPPGFRLLVEVDAQGSIRILIGGAPAATDASAACGALPPEALQAPTPALHKSDGEEHEKPPASGLEAARQVAEKQGEDALLKYSEWDKILPRCVVRREIKRALQAGQLPCTTKGSKRDGRARMISARDMVQFFTEGVDER